MLTNCWDKQPYLIMEFVRKSDSLARCVLLMGRQVDTLRRLSELETRVFRRVFKRIISENQTAHFKIELLCFSLHYILTTGDTALLEEMLPDQNYPDDCPDLTNQLLVQLSSDIWTLSGDTNGSRTAYFKLRMREHSEYYDLLQAN